MLKVFYAQPVDNVDPAVLREKVDALRGLMSGMNVEISAPYLSEPPLPQDHMDRVAAEQVVRADLAAIDECDVLIADLSAPGWQFVGAIFEMAYASLKGKVVLVYGGSSPIAGRTFIVATATHICVSWDDMRRKVEDLLERT